MATWADDFFVDWQRAWGTGTEAVLEYVSDDIEYWDVTLPEPIHGRDAYAKHCDNFFSAFTECEWSMREPVICEGDRVTEPWAFTGINSGPIWTGLPATGRRLESKGTDIFEFRDSKVCREHSFYDVVGNLRALGLWPGIGSKTEGAAMTAAGLAIRGTSLVKDRLP
ncbi:MAG: hypothetical protein QG596_1061 [Actinomycetota bacterium]|jgi:steroid delta-isomerase-like uncharacterized protein|nr:hypothetical protein [Actinomycetota bacterium]